MLQAKLEELKLNETSFFGDSTIGFNQTTTDGKSTLEEQSMIEKDLFLTHDTSCLEDEFNSTMFSEYSTRG
jgi:hypothetical protein